MSRRARFLLDWLLLVVALIAGWMILGASAVGAQEVGPITVPVSPIPGLSNAQLWVVAAPMIIVGLGTFLRYLPPETPDVTKRLIVGAASALMAAGGLYAEGRLDLANWFGTFLTILFLAGGYFAILWKPFQDGVLFKIRETAKDPTGKVVDTGN